MGLSGNGSCTKHSYVQTWKTAEIGTNMLSALLEEGASRAGLPDHILQIGSRAGIECNRGQRIQRKQNRYFAHPKSHQIAPKGEK
jgi:hypothetical protein